MRSRFLAALAGVLVMAPAALVPTGPVSHATTNSAVQASPKHTVVQKAPFAAAPETLTTSVVQPTVINPKKYNKYKGPNLSQRVVMTFDDCPNNLAELQSVLTYVSTRQLTSDKLESIGLVFAPTGVCVEDFKKRYGVDIAALMRAHGQYVINHSYDHPNLTKLKKNGKFDAKRVKANLSTEVKTDYGRAPFGARNKDVDKVYASIGMRQWLWNVDTNDWRKGKTRSIVVNYVGKHACAGCTVLMHMQHKGFHPAAIAQMDAKLRARGLHTCRAFRGWDNPPAGPVRTTPAKLGNYALPC